jgi:hypothetical protein
MYNPGFTLFSSCKFIPFSSLPLARFYRVYKIYITGMCVCVRAVYIFADNSCQYWKRMTGIPALFYSGRGSCGLYTTVLLCMWKPQMARPRFYADPLLLTWDLHSVQWVVQLRSCTLPSGPHFMNNITFQIEVLETTVLDFATFYKNIISKIVVYFTRVYHYTTF